jgi:hypothetical protein
MLFIPDLVLLKIDSLHLLLSLCVKVVGRYRGNECVHTSVAGHDEPAVPASGWSSPGMNLSETAMPLFPCLAGRLHAFPGSRFRFHSQIASSRSQIICDLTRSKAHRRQPRSFSLLDGGSVPDARARTPTPQWWCSMQCMEAGFWAEHSRFFRNADTQNALCASVAGCRSSQNGHKTRADVPVVSDARYRSALVRENCLPVIASAQPKPTPFRHSPTCSEMI